MSNDRSERHFALGEPIKTIQLPPMPIAKRKRTSWPVILFRLLFRRGK